MLELTGQVALITGGARGIGAAITRKLAAQGADVAINFAGSEAAAKELAAECEGLGVKANIYKCNVAEYSECEVMINQVIADFGKIDILVNNAGITNDKLLMQMTSEDFDKVIDVNLKGCYNTMKLVNRPMMKNKYGRIINMSSIVGIHGQAGQANYAASKAGIIGLTKSVAAELASRNITVNAIAPGMIDTEMTQVLSDATKESILSQIPAKRAGSTEEVANLVAFLASKESSYITAQVIGVDGGMGA